MNTSIEQGRHFLPDVAVVGDINPDLILYGLPADLPEERELLASGFISTLGGSSAILSHNLAALGTRVSLTGVVGADSMGALCWNRLAAVGVEMSGIRCADGDSVTGVTIILPHGARRRILTFPGCMAELTSSDLDRQHLARARHFHISSPFLQSKLLPCIPSLLREMKTLGLTTSIDPNDVPLSDGASFFEEIVSLVDILFCTEEEFARLQPCNPDPRRFPEERILALKRGASGASIYTGGKQIDVLGLTVNVVDSIGAGDSFDAGFLHLWLKGAPLDECGRFANLIGALSVTRPGGTEALRDARYREKFLKENWPYLPTK